MSGTETTRSRARGKWNGILKELGVPDKALTGKHGPCPICQAGKDRFRFDNKDGYGSWICNQCGSGDGIDLAMKITGKPFKVVAALIDEMVGGIRAQSPALPLNDEWMRRLKCEVINQAQPLAEGDLVAVYLRGRGLVVPPFPSALQFVARLNDGDGALRPCMVASIRDQQGRGVSLHRTFLTSDGTRKAEMASPRKLMPGSLPKGVSVRLADFQEGEPLGIAEGIETALSASALFGMPVWAALDASKLEGWRPPRGCKAITIFGDNDRNYTGQRAAYGLARRLTNEGMQVQVEIPKPPGADWNDILKRRSSIEENGNVEQHENERRSR